jgi:hypothetical protein
MRCHDFRLKGYAVTNFGSEILLELVYDYPNQPVETSRIKFSEVEAYHFIHTGGSIIISITQIPLSMLFREVGGQIAEWYRMHGGYIHWNKDFGKYAEALERNGYHAWEIDSAVGFEGFVIARKAEEVENENLAQG